MGFLTLGKHRQPAAHRRMLAACVIPLTVRAPSLLLRHMALPPARRGDPQCGRYRLDDSLTVGRMMRREMHARDTPIAAFKRDFHLGAHQRVVVIDQDDRYAGIALPAEVHADADESTMSAICCTMPTQSCCRR
jgi:hypothetical protein